MQLERYTQYSFSPSLATSIGLAEAILIGRLEALFSGEADDPRLVWVDGERWLIATFRSLQRREFPFLNLEIVRTALKRLNRLGIVVSEVKPCGREDDLLYWHHRLIAAALPKRTKDDISEPGDEDLAQSEDGEEEPEFAYQSQLEHPHLHYRSRLVDDLPAYRSGSTLYDRPRFRPENR